MDDFQEVINKVVGDEKAEPKKPVVPELTEEERKKMSDEVAKNIAK